MPNSYSCWTPAFGLPSTLSASYYAWGDNAYGQFGDGTNINSNVPIPVLAGKKIIQVAAGSQHSLILAADSKLYACGANQSGQLGDGSANNSNVPVAVIGLADKTIIQVAAGNAESLALTSDGKVYAWGYNENGQLGNGTNTSSNVPVLVSSLADKTITQVAAGGYHSLALAADGKVYAWGYNVFGQLGNGTNTDSNVPIPVTGVLTDKTIIKVAAGGAHTLALTADGTVYAWGYNAFGQLGDGTTTDSNVPVVVTSSDGKQITQVDAGYAHSLALAADGTVYAWGDNQSDQLGNGTNTSSNVPVLVSSLADKTITQVAAGGYHSLALAADGKLYAWGNNSSGQLGNGTTIDSTVPVAVKGLRRITQVAAGGLHVLAL